MTQPANVLFITCDQLRKDALGCYGNPVVQTPNIDALANRGVRFERMFTAYPVCAPNRGAIATGRYPHINGLWGNGVCLPETETTIMQSLRQRGYATYGLGKMHFGPQWQYPPDGGPLIDPGPELAVNPQPSTDQMPWHGFDHVAITEDHRVGPYADYLAKHGYDTWNDVHSFSYPQHSTTCSPFPEEHHQTTWVADRSLEALADHPGDRPFFMWTSFVDPHHPFNPPAPFDTMYDPQDMPLPVWDQRVVERWPKRYRQMHFATEGSHVAIGMHQLPDAEWQRCKAYYYGMVSLIDKQVGRLIDALDTRGMLENTLIIFSADHGELLGDHHLIFKGATYDCVTNMPLIMCGPGIDGHRGQRAGLCNAIDIMPTTLDLVGWPMPKGVQGQSIVPMVRDEACRIRDAELIWNNDLIRSIRTEDHLLTWHGPGAQGELYDLHADPHCLNNLWDQPSATALQRQLADQLLALIAANVDPLPERVGPC